MQLTNSIIELALGAIVVAFLLIMAVKIWNESSAYAKIFFGVVGVIGLLVLIYLYIEVIVLALLAAVVIAGLAYVGYHAVAGN